jgi:hypothetical protein
MAAGRKIDLQHSTERRHRPRNDRQGIGYFTRLAGLVLFALFSGLVLSGCEGPTLAVVRVLTAPPLSEPPQELLDLCDEHLGYKIYHPIDEVVDGFLVKDETDWGDGPACIYACPKDQLKFGFRYQEAEISPALIFENPPDNISPGYLMMFVDAPGRYRYTLEKIGHPNCRAFEKWHALSIETWKRQGYSGERVPDFESVCIAANPIHEFKAKYELRFLKKRRKRNYGYLVTLYGQIVERSSGRLMAEGREHWTSYELHDGGFSCPPTEKKLLGFSDVVRQPKREPTRN